MKLPRPRELAATRMPRGLELYNQAVAAQRNGRTTEAIAGYRKAIALQPDLACAHSNLGMALMEQGKFPEAIVCYENALAINNGDAETLNNMGNARKAQGDLMSAIDCYRKSIDANVNFVAAYNNMGTALDELGKGDEALICYRRALEIDPTFADCYNNIGVVLKRKGKTAEARESYERALKLRPNYAEAYNNLAGILKDQGRNEESLELVRKAVASKPGAADMHSNLLFSLNCIPNMDPAEIAAEHRKWAARHASAKQARTMFTNTPDPSRTLRVGYCSPDFRDHSVSFFLEPILASHNAENVELFAYAEVRKPDAATERIKRKFSQWRSTVGLSDAQVVELVRNDKIDILIDLAGHTLNNRLTAMAHKAAPVQISYLGYPNTTGVSAIDYRITDRLADPAEHQALNVEELVHLPGSFLCYAPSADAPGVGPLPASLKGHLTFGSFNAIHKINAEAINLWCEILRALPAAKLLLKCFQFSEDETRARYFDLFEKNRIDRERVQIVAWEPSRSNHYGLYNEIDVALDPFPYNGTTTTCEGLWMGVPALTLAGNSHVSRVGASILHRVGLDEFVAATPAEYVAKAVACASNIEKLVKIRAELRERMAVSPLCDARQFTVNLEAAFRAMWKRWCARQRGESDPGAVDAQLEKDPVVRAVRADGKSGVMLRESADKPAATQAAAKAEPEKTEAAPNAASQSMGRAAEAAILADAMARLGQRVKAYQYAQLGLSSLRRGHYAGGVPQTLLNAWQAPDAEGLLLRQCLAYSCHSSFYARAISQDWLMAWAQREPQNPEPFLRFGLLFAVAAIEEGKPIPKPAIEALLHAQRIQCDQRPELALALLKGGLKEMAVPYDGTAIYVPPDLRVVSTYVLLEQGDWFEEDLDLFRALIRPGDKVLDLGANIGVYSVAAAQRVGREGCVVSIEPAAKTFGVLQKSAKLNANMTVRRAAVSDKSGKGCLEPDRAPELNRLSSNGCGGEAVDLISVDELAAELGIDHFDVIKMDVEGHEKATLRGAAKIMGRQAPIVFYEVREGNDLHLDLVDQFKTMGFESFVYCAGQKALVHYDAGTEVDAFLLNMVAIKPEAFPRLDGIVRLF